jgi:hypothetical protein
MLNKPYLSVQEMVNLTVDQQHAVKADLGKYGHFDPWETASIYNHPKASVRQKLKESLRHISLGELLMKSGADGIAGAAYLIPDKLHDDLVFYALETDATPLISAYMVNGWAGGDLKVDIVNDHTYIAEPMISGAQMPDQTGEIKAIASTTAALKPNSFGINIPIGEDLIEDNPHNLVEWHVRQAAKACGRLSTDYALSVLLAGTDGWGTVNAGVTGDVNETKFYGGTTTDVMDAIRAVGDDGWLVNTMVVTPEAYCHSMSVDIGAVGWAGASPPENRHFTCKLAELDVLKNTSTKLHASTDLEGEAFTACKTILFDRNNAMLTGRKRWMRIENYSDPTHIVQGAVVSCRQDSITLYNDAIYVLTESTQ